VLAQQTKLFPKVSRSQRNLENITKLAGYQFGNDIAKQLLKSCTIQGKYPYQKIKRNSTQLGMITEERGYISLTLEGAKQLVKTGAYWVNIFDDFTLKGSVFAPGVKDADASIRIGDEVVVLQNSTLCAVGVAVMNGEEMKNLKQGEAVKIRHRH